MNSFTFKLVSLFLCCTIGAAVPGYGQQTITPPSPEAAAMIRSINIPVGHYTGTVDVNIPLYTIKTRDFEIPIQLQYHTSGIKVHDFASWVGLGWKLSVPGSIHRIIKGGRDEYGFKVLHGKIIRDSTWNETLFNKYINNIDSESDIFYFDLLGSSGMMVYNPEGELYTIPYRKIKIEDNASSAYNIYTFIITDENGIKYTFEPSEYTFTEDERTLTYGWSIAKIESPQGDWIEFDYISDPKFKYTYPSHTNNSATYEVTTSPFSRILKQNTNEPQEEVSTPILPLYLSCIRWASGKLEFISDDQRQAMDVQTRRLTEIKLFAESNRYIKSFKLTYSTFLNSALQLWKIEEANTEQNLIELICLLNYNMQQNLPYRNSLDMDHWGYYNGPNTSNGHQYPTHIVQGHTIAGADRSPHWPYTMANILTSITYKGGGKKEFEYEPNQLASGQIVGGVRIKAIKEYVSASSTPFITQYEYLESEAYDSVIYYTSIDTESPYLGAKFTYKINSLSANSLLDINGSPIVYPLVKEILPNGSYNTYKFTSFSQYPDSVPDIYTPISSGMMHEPSSYQIRTYLPKTSYAWARGLLLEQCLYAADGTLQMRQNNYYNIDTPAKEEIICATLENSQYPIFGTNTQCFTKYRWISKPIYLDSTVTQKGPYTLPLHTSYIYDTTYLNIKEIIYKDASKNTYKTTYKYPFDYNKSDLTSNQEKALRYMKEHHLINIPIETISEKNDMIIEGKLSTYHEDHLGYEGADLRKYTDLKLSLSEPLNKTSFVPSNSGKGIIIDNHYDTLYIYNEFDQSSNPIYTQTLQGDEYSYIYGYNKQLLIAAVHNARTREESSTTDRILRGEIFHTSFEDDTISQVKIVPLAKTGRKVYQGVYELQYSGPQPTDTLKLTYWISYDQGQSWTKKEEIRPVWGNIMLGEENAYIDEIRIYPRDAQMTTYTYLPGIGITTQTDVNDNTTYYEYDALGRLTTIRNNERHLLKKYDYQ